jgi:NitT/TauT family transport system ATP-binding protein
VKNRLHIIKNEPHPLLSPVVFEIEHLGKRLKTNDPGEVSVLKDISFTARRGEMICILGRSGCGKSTLLNILAGFMPPTSGNVRLNGRPISRPGPDRCVVFQEDALFPWLTVRENIAFGLKDRRMDRDKKKFPVA